MTKSHDSAAEETSEDRSPHRIRGHLERGLVTGALLLLVAVEPVLAQDSVVCEASKLPPMIEGFFQLTTAIGLMGVVVLLQGDALLEMFTFSREQKEAIKRHKRTATKSAIVLLVLGPLYTVAGEIMGLPLAECVDLAPW